MKNVWLMLTIVLITSSVALSQDQVTEGRNTFNRGVQAFRNGDVSGALDLFTEAKRLDPNLTVADLYIAAAYSSMFIPGNVTLQNQDIGNRAISAYEDYVTENPNRPEGWSGLAGIYQNTKNFQKARNCYLRLTSVTPQNASGFYGLGAVDWMLLADKNNDVPDLDRASILNEGLAALNRALELNPRYADAMTYTNLLLREKAKGSLEPTEVARLTAEADSWFNKAVEVRRQNVLTQTQAGVFAGGPGIELQANADAPPAPLPPPPFLPREGVAPIRIGGDVAQGNLIQRVQPVYPESARAARIQGVVLLQAIIDRGGLIGDLKVIAGHPILNDAAIAAVRQWRYQPVLLNGQPIEVITTISVNFAFQ